MSLSNDSIVIVPSEGPMVASQTVSAKELQVMIPSDHLGTIRKSGSVFGTCSTMNNTQPCNYELFNGSSSNIIRVVSLKTFIDTTTAVTGISAKMRLIRISAIGSGGVNLTLVPMVAGDSLPSGITSRKGVTSTPTEAGNLMTYFWNYDEANASAILTTMLSASKHFDLIPWTLRKSGIVLRPGEGLAIMQDTATTAGSGMLSVKIIVE